MYDSYDSTMYESSSSTSTGDPAVALGALLFVFIFLVAVYALYAFLLGRIFKKAGIEQWKAWVPVYNQWKVFEMGNQPGWWAVLALVPFVNFVAVIFMYIAMYKIGLGFKKDGVFVLLAVFLPIVWYAWLAFDSSKWQPVEA